MASCGTLPKLWNKVRMLNDFGSHLNLTDNVWHIAVHWPKGIVGHSTVHAMPKVKTDAHAKFHIRSMNSCVCAASASLRALKCAFLALRRRFFSPASQRWQNVHFVPFSHPFVRKNAHGLQSPVSWPAEPMLGTSAKLNFGSELTLECSGT